MTKRVIDPLLQSAPTDQRTSVVLLPDSVFLDDVPAQEVYFLAEDADVRNAHPPGKPVSYTDILQLIFGAERVITL